MKAIVYTEYGSPDVLHLAEVEKPTPKDHEVLVKVHATTVNYGDLIGRNFKNLTKQDFNMPSPLLLIARLDFGLRKPKRPILGSEFSGEIAALGKDVTRFQVGEPVFGYLGQQMGAYAEYICVAQDACIAPKPAQMSYEEAAAMPYGAIMAWGVLRQVNIKSGGTVLVNGASGSIGSFALQFAKLSGAEVTAVCGTPRLEFVKALGADKVIDYTQTDFTQNGETYDLIVDVLGKSDFSKVKNSLKPTGRYLLASFKMHHLFQMVRTRGSKQKVICALASGSPDDLLAIHELAETGKIKTIIDQIYPLEQAAAAHRYAESGQKRGHVVIKL